jgi:hypothetical protein
MSGRETMRATVLAAIASAIIATLGLGASAEAASTRFPAAADDNAPTVSADSEPDESATAPMPLDLALAKKLLLPEPLASVQKIIGTPGETNSTEGKVVSVRWWHDCGGDTMSFGDVFIRDGQVAHLWFQGCAGENIIRDADGDFYVLEANGTERYLTETAKERAFSEGQIQFVAKALRVPCAMMAIDIQAIAEEHLGYPDEIAVLAASRRPRPASVIHPCPQTASNPNQPACDRLSVKY